MKYEEVLNYIHSLGNFSLPSGLERIYTVLEKLGNPQNKFPAIHIAGTNGKGSVSAMLASIFKEAGYKTGLFISPFIIEFSERIQINGEFISEEDLCRLVKKVRETEIQLTEFEFITAVAFLYFEEQGCDIVICETGLGGRLDATNTLGNKKMAIICKIGLDHTAILGDTIEKITKEKCGIIKDCPVVVNPFQNDKALKVIKQCTDKLFIPDTRYYTPISDNGFIYKDREYDLSLKGEFQKENALTVLEAIECSGYKITYDNLYKALNNTFFPARMETVCRAPLIVLDGAHNPDGAQALLKEIKKYNNKVTALIGMMSDKDYEEVLKIILPYCKNAVVTEVVNLPRSLKGEELVIVASQYTNCFVEKDYLSAIIKAKEICNGEPIFVFGSLYLAAAIRPILLEMGKTLNN